MCVQLETQLQNRDCCRHTVCVCVCVCVCVGHSGAGGLADSSISLLYITQSSNRSKQGRYVSTDPHEEHGPLGDSKALFSLCSWAVLTWGPWTVGPPQGPSADRPGRGKGEGGDGGVSCASPLGAPAREGVGV